MKNKTKILTLILVILVVAGTVTFLAKPELFQGKLIKDQFYEHYGYGACEGPLPNENSIFERNNVTLWGGRGANPPKWDECKSDNIVIQYSCNPEPGPYANTIKEEIECPSGTKCKLGACVKVRYPIPKKSSPSYKRGEQLRENLKEELKLIDPKDVKLNQTNDNSKLIY